MLLADLVPQVVKSLIPNQEGWIRFSALLSQWFLFDIFTQIKLLCTLFVSTTTARPQNVFFSDPIQGIIPNIEIHMHWLYDYTTPHPPLFFIIIPLLFIVTLQKNIIQRCLSFLWLTLSLQFHVGTITYAHLILRFISITQPFTPINLLTTYKSLQRYGIS